MINILISDDNNDLVELIFKEIFRKNKNFRLSDYTYDGESTFDSIIKYQPDVIILDIQMPKKSGVEIIEQLNLINNKYKPYIIVISSYQELIDKININKNIYAIINKGNGFESFLNKITQYLNEIDIEINNNKTYTNIKNEIEKFQINSQSKGYIYLIDTIMLSYNLNNYNLNKDIYSKLSSKYKVSPMNIKWDIEKCIKAMKRYTDSDLIFQYFNVTNKENLTTKNVIETIKENIKLSR